MLSLPPSVRVFVCTAPTDMRKSFDGLCALVQTVLEKDPFSGHLFTKERKMRPLFTIHGGEYLVGSYIEKRYPELNLWIPSRNTGIDFLVTDASNERTVSLQVKFSKDFIPFHSSSMPQRMLVAGSWWTLQEKKIADSRADLWVFVLPSFTERRTHFIVVPPAELLRRFRAIHGTKKKRLQSYFWITRSRRCWEARGLKKADQEQIVLDTFEDKHRDFTAFLDNWPELEGS